MDEQGWFASVDIEQMLAALVGSSYPDAEPCNWGEGERKKALYVLACLHPVWHMLPSEYAEALEALGEYADGNAAPEILFAKWTAAEEVSSEYSGVLFAIGYDDIGLCCHYLAEMQLVGAGAAEFRQAALLRDIFGNPFRPVAFDPAWRTETVVGIARGIYEDRAFERMPILADALQDAGCEHPDILTHCREPGEHVRGCWVVDLVLGKV